MEYDISRELNTHDLLFWMLELAKTRWPKAAVYLRLEEDRARMISKGLDPLMYGCLYPKGRIESLKLVCPNGDSVAYTWERSGRLDVEGQGRFVESFREQPPKAHRNLSMSAMALRFSVSDAFARVGAGEQLRRWFQVAREGGGRFLLSDEAIAGGLVPVVSRYALDAYKQIVNVVVELPTGWLLWDLRNSMVYAYGMGYSAAAKLLMNIIDE